MKFRLILVGLFLSTTLFAQSNDSAFLTARDAFRAGDLNKLERATSQLGNHELAPYAESYRLRMWIDKGDPADMRDFLQRNEGSYVAEKLRADWIRWLGKRAMWTDVDAEFPSCSHPNRMSPATASRPASPAMTRRFSPRPKSSG
jgi:soluble lytic murein transglycosylase